MLRLPPSFTASGVCLYLFASKLFVAPNFISFWISFQFLSTDNTRSHVCHVTVAAGRELIRMWQWATVAPLLSWRHLTTTTTTGLAVSRSVNITTYLYIFGRCQTVLIVWPLIRSISWLVETFKISRRTFPSWQTDSRQDSPLSQAPPVLSATFTVTRQTILFYSEIYLSLTSWEKSKFCLWKRMAKSNFVITFDISFKN